MMYSMREEGNELLSDHFRVNEFRCKDGSDPVFVDGRLLLILEYVRSRFGKPVVVNSGYRTPAYNKKIGGAKFSQHMYGRAADIVVKGVKPLDVYNCLCEAFPNTCGFGLYASFVHVDYRETKSRWKG
uniref:Peptidase n=1 Tax=Dulem virus 195 TaxID=3145672 RepID=A0AAU8B2B9_9VIRU